MILAQTAGTKVEGLKRLEGPLRCLPVDFLPHTLNLGVGRDISLSY